MSASAHLALLGRQARDCLLEFDPVHATLLGAHDGDGRLPDFGQPAVDAHLRRLDDLLVGIDAIDDVDLAIDEQVDLEILRARITARSFDHAEIARHRWDPLIWDPASGLHALAIRDVGPDNATALDHGTRLDNVRSRLAAVPEFLDLAQRTLDDMSAVHVETALRRLDGFDLVLEELQPLGTLGDERVDAARDAVDRHRRWLDDRLHQARRDPRLGVRLYSAAVWHHLDEEVAPVQILERAEAHLDEVTALMRETAAEILGESVRAPDVVRRALTQSQVLEPGAVVPAIEAALARTSAFARDLLTMPEVEIRIGDMPLIHRGVAVAYCDAPGPLEQDDFPTYVAVAPPPAEWSPAQVASFLREYNADLLHGLTIHEAMPGHAVQLAKARHSTTSLIRRLAPSGTFIEGWAVYAEEIMVERGYTSDSDPSSGLRMRLQQLKMQARMTLNAILDARVHGGDIDEAGAVDLLRRRGFQEEAEAAGKWRRALLTAAQLPTYFVGWWGVRHLVDDLRVVHPDWSDRQVHDLVLAQGSIGPRHLRTVLGL